MPCNEIKFEVIAEFNDLQRGLPHKNWVLEIPAPADAPEV